jgi:hypothetical protein
MSLVPENQPSEGVFMLALTLLAAVASLGAWAVLIFGGVTTLPATHLLLALGAILLVRWWALRA